MSNETPTIDDSNLHALSDLSTYNCLRFGPYTALIYEDQQEVRQYTNIDIAREAAQLAQGLQTLGIQKGDRIIVIMPNCPEVLIAYQAIPRAGGIIIPVLPLLKPPEVRYIAQNAAAKAIITSATLLPQLHSALADLPSMQHIISTGTTSANSTSPTSHLQIHPYHELIATSHSDQSNVHPEGDLPTSHQTTPIPVDLDDIAVILYTSGTTDHPKGVVLTHRNLIANALAANALNTQQEALNETFLAVLPLAHAYGIIASNVFFLRGLTMIMHSRFDTTAIFSAIARHRIAFFAGVPAMFAALLYSPDGDNADISSLKTCLSSSAPLPLAILQGFEQKFGCRILEGYGLSEATALTAHPPYMQQKPGSVGKPIPGIAVLVVDEKDQPVPVGAVGEIIARGPNIMQGYYNMPTETAAALKNGWLYTGDMGRFDEDGYLYIVERKKDLIIRGGLNVYPHDVEEILNTHPAVMESAVVGIPSERMGEEVKAFVVTRSPVDAETLIAHCQKSLANYKTPSEIEFVRSLPRNLMGKIDKKALRKATRLS